MGDYSLSAFFKETVQSDADCEVFELENDYILDIILDGSVKTKKHSMIAYTGDINFEQSAHSSSFEKLLNRLIPDDTENMSPMMNLTGKGHVYVADHGKNIEIIKLKDESIYVNASNLLAFEESIKSEITTMSSSGMVAGGFIIIKLTGSGFIAITTHPSPLTLKVRPDEPIFTDPNATVAWSEGLELDTSIDVNLNNIVNRSSGEMYQMSFLGEGFVVVQPFEEIEYEIDED